MIKHRTKNSSINMHKQHDPHCYKLFLCLRWFTETSFCEINPAVLGSQMKICDHQCLFLSAVSLDFSTHPPLKGKGENPLHGTTTVSPKEQFETTEKEHPKSAKRHFIGYNSFSDPHNLENWIWHEHAKTTDCYSEVLNWHGIYIYIFSNITSIV